MLWEWLLLIHFVTIVNLTWALQLNNLLIFCIFCSITTFFLLDKVFITYVVLFYLTRLFDLVY